MISDSLSISDGFIVSQTGAQSQKKRTFSEMNQESGDQSNDFKKTDPGDAGNGDPEPSSSIHQIPFRYDDQQFPAQMVKRITAKVFGPNTSNQELCESITRWMCKIGMCVPCIYSMATHFQCISDQSDGAQLLHSLIQLDRECTPSSIHNKHCFICNDLYRTLYDSATQNTLFSGSGLAEYEFDSYFLTPNIPPLLSMRDFYVIHHLHRSIPGSCDVVTFPAANTPDFHRDTIRFMMDTLSAPLLDVKVDHDRYPVVDGVRSRFGFCNCASISNSGVHIKCTFYAEHIQSVLGLHHQQKSTTMNKSQSQKKRGNYKRKWNRKDSGHLPPEKGEWKFKMFFLVSDSVTVLSSVS